MSRPIANHAQRTRARRCRCRRAVSATLGCLAFAAAAAVAPATAAADIVIDLRAATVNGLPVADPNTIAITKVGDVANIDVYARVSGTNTLNDETFKLIHGVFRSSTGGLLGDLQSFNVAPFIGSAAQGGSQVDADSDGDLDIGQQPNGGAASTFFVAFSANDEPDGIPLLTSPAAEEFLIGTLTWTATSNEGETFIDFIRRRNPGNPGGNGPGFMTYNQDPATDPLNSLRTGTAPYSTDGLRIIGVPEPGSLALAPFAALRLLARRRPRGAR
jgi:hypothetical protein